MSWIEVDEEVLGTIKKGAEPFFDSPNDALRRVFGLEVGARPSCMQQPSADRPRAAAVRPARPRARAGELLPIDDYELPLLRALSQLGGSAPKARVADAIEELLGHRLKLRDREPLGSGESRWESRLAFARLQAIERGHLKTDSPRGVWELSEAGIERLGELESRLGDGEGEAR
jgi:hypothetical protein